MKLTVAPDSSRTLSRLRPLLSLTPALSLVAGIALLAGCPGQLEGDFPPVGGTGTGGESSGTGGASSGTGGSVSGSGGSGSGTGGSIGTGGSTVACDAPTTIFKPNCSMAGCHDGSTTPPDLAHAPVEMSIIGKKATLGSCAGMNLVDSSASGSVFMKRLMGGDCGPQMPYFMIYPYLSSTQLQCVTDWLTSKLK